MTNTFLKVNKDLFNLGLSPIEILILSQIMEFNTNTGDCFISDKTLAEQFGVSEKTISRTLNSLEKEKGFIIRSTKNVKGGRERHMSVNLTKIEEVLTKDKMTLDEAQQTKSPLTTDNLSIDNRQNDFIKDNILKENLKNNIVEMFHTTCESISLTDSKKLTDQEKMKLIGF